MAEYFVASTIMFVLLLVCISAYIAFALHDEHKRNQLYVDDLRRRLAEERRKTRSGQVI